MKYVQSRKQLFTWPNVKKKGKDLEMLWRAIVQNVMYLQLQRGWSKPIRTLLMSNAKK